MGQVSQFGSPPRGKTSYWLALAAAGALLLIAVAVGFALWREEHPRDCRALSHGAESTPTLIGLETAENMTCGEAAQAVRRAEEALSDAGAEFETLEGMRVRTERGEQCDVSFRWEFEWKIICRAGDKVLIGHIIN